MALPINNPITYKLKVPSTGKEIKFRPFLVKDEKSLLVAQQSEDVDVMVETLKNVIRSCTNDSVDVDSLAIFDIEYIFAKIRSKSVGEVSDIIFKCGACNEKGNTVKIPIDISELEVERTEGHTNKIPLYNDIGVIMKYPNLDTLKLLENGIKNPEQIFDVIMNSIDIVYDSEEMYHTKEQSKEELVQFIENLTNEQFSKLENFFKTMPKFRKKVEFDCPICKTKNETYLEGVQNFFS